jgi:pteridine reductase
MPQDLESTEASAAALAGKVALVTGGARRIGASIVTELHRSGMNVVIHYYHSGDDAQTLAGALNALRCGSASLVRGNLLDDAGPSAIIDEAQARWGRLDLLVNNASSFYPTPVGSIDVSAWDDLVGTNLKAPLFLSQAAREPLRQHRGAIVNIADIHADRPLTEHAVYCAAKAGLLMLTRALARDLAPDIRVNAISPGAILWPGTAHDSPDEQGKSQAEVLRATPLGRQGEPRDIARTVLFLMRDAPYITGENISVDGGRSLGFR